MFNEEFDYEEKSQPIARCTECGRLIYDNSRDVYMDCKGNYFCSLDCSLYYYGIHQSEDCYVVGD